MFLCPYILPVGLKPAVGPVLVVCYTNHALDSFLEDMLDAGIKDIVRVGSPSKISERLKPYSLQEIGLKVRPCFRYSCLLISSLWATW